MKPFKTFLKEQYLTENPWKSITYSKGGEFGVPGVTAATIRRLGQAGKTALPAKGAIDKAKSAALQTTQAKLALSPGRRSVLGSQGAGLGKIQQEISKGLQNYSNKFKPSVAAKANYAQKLGAAAHMIPKKLPKNFKPDPGFVAPRNDPMSLGVSAIPAAAVAAVGAPALGLGSSAAALPGAALRAAPKVIRPGGKTGMAVQAALPATGISVGGSNVLKQVKGAVDPGGGRGITKMDVLRGAASGLNPFGKRQKLSRAEMGSVASVFGKSKEGLETVSGVGAEVAAGAVAPTVALSTRAPNMQKNWAKAKQDVTSTVAKLTGQQHRKSVGQLLTPGSPDFDKKHGEAALRGAGKLSMNIGTQTVERQQSQAAQNQAFQGSRLGKAITKTQEKLYKPASQTPMSVTRAFQSGGPKPQKGFMGIGGESPAIVKQKAAAVRQHTKVQAHAFHRTPPKTLFGKPGPGYGQPFVKAAAPKKKKGLFGWGS